MSSQNEHSYFKLQCSTKQVSRTDVCTNCYSRICNTCQIREDFVFSEILSGSQRSELFVDEIYTCNRCDQTWMDLFQFCFNCGRLVCANFQDKHDDCPKVYGLMKSDVVKRRRLKETEDEMTKLEITLRNNQSSFDEICKREETSQFLSVLNDSKAFVISKVEDIVQLYVNDSSVFKSQLSSVANILSQHTASMENLKSSLENIKRKTVFPVTFLQEATEFEGKLKTLSHVHAQIDISTLQKDEFFNLECKPIEVDVNVINNLLGIVSRNKVEIPDVPCSLQLYGSSSVETGYRFCRERQHKQEAKRQTRSETLPHHERKRSESSWFKISKLEEEIKLKDERIEKLTSDKETYKKQLFLFKRSRDAAKEKLAASEKTLKEILSQQDIELQRKDELYKYEAEKLKGIINQLHEEREDWKRDTENQMQAHLKKQENLRTKHETLVMSLNSQIEQLFFENTEKEAARLKAERDTQEANYQVERYNRKLMENTKLLDVQRCQIEQLQDIVNSLEKERQDHRNEKLETENQRLREKLLRIKHMFNDWSKSSISLNNMMAHELNHEDTAVDLLTENERLKRQLIAMDVDRQHAVNILNSTTDITEGQKMDDLERCQFNAQPGIIVGGVTTEKSSSKHLTSITYNAQQIHVIQHSQVSLADSGYDAQSLFGDKE